MIAFSIPGGPKTVSDSLDGLKALLLFNASE
jgi:hypothetical protein